MSLLKLGKVQRTYVNIKPYPLTFFDWKKERPFIDLFSHITVHVYIQRCNDLSISTVLNKVILGVGAPQAL